MLPQMGAAAESLSKASSLVMRIGTDAHLYDDPDDVSIKPLLESRYDSEKVDALKRLLALIAQGADVSHFFPQVVKNVASHSLEVKKLVYLYLLHYAEKRQNEALLSINCFQKDLSDTNPLVRAWALRAMTGIRLHVVSPLILAAITKCARDPSPYVRKCAAYALPKLYNLHQEETSSLEQLVDVLLRDNSPAVVGSASVAFNAICPNNYPLISKHFRRLCEALPDVEEWSQIILIEILLRYTVARHGLVRESVLFADITRDSTFSSVMRRCYVEGHELWSGDGRGFEEVEMGTCKNEDVDLLLKCTAPLLWSQNSAVVLAAAGVHWIVGPAEEVKKIVKPILFLLRSSSAVKYVVLCNILAFAKAAPLLFDSFYEDFFISSSDSYQIKTIKLEILSTIATKSSVPFIFEEFQDYIRDPDRRFVADTVAVIGFIAKRLAVLAGTCLEGLLKLVLSEPLVSGSYQVEEEDGVLVQAIISIKSILKQDPSSHEKVIVRLVRNLDRIKNSASRALIIWIFGEYSSIGDVIPKIAPTVLKYLAWSFHSDEVEAKLQILNTCAKVTAKTKGNNKDSTLFKKILNYILQLATFDQNYDVRDRARFIRNLMGNETKNNLDIYRDLAESMFCTKPASSPYPSANIRVYLPGSLSQVVLHAAPGYTPLPKPGSAVIENPAGLDNSSDVDESEGSSPQYSTEDNRLGYDTGTEEMSENGEYEETPLVNISEANVDQGQTSQNDMSNFVSTDLSEMMSRSALESWLDETPCFSDGSFGQSRSQNVSTSNARVSFNDRNFKLKPRKSHALLEPANSDGLRISYSFSTEVSSVSPLLVCVDLLFENFAKETLRNINIRFEEASGSSISGPMDPVLEDSASMVSPDKIPTLLPMEEIPLLSPNETVKRILQLRFQHHLLPLKLHVLCNGKMYLGKLWPDIAYFLRPLSLDMNSFVEKEKQLPGMFECSRRCTFSDHLQELEQNEKISVNADKSLVVAHCFAVKILSSSNFYLVSMDMPVSLKPDDMSGLCLRFAGEVVNSSKPCLITVIAHGNLTEPLDVTVKLNSEDTVFGLNLLNRLLAIVQ
ncbi:hypothetical protein LUZ63_012131 [Rhynchospora breviuscula]|uniref:AP-3 complex subunit beta n=1 Tax=Rhynchospora breviuscula TaxID=2022672 RepID=A0A9Q0CKB6_9POAL|nr:hypothetical protein LUZ63_012131 [Rhynchospora breviuscula]